MHFGHLDVMPNNIIKVLTKSLVISYVNNGQQKINGVLAELWALLTYQLEVTLRVRTVSNLKVFHNALNFEVYCGYILHVWSGFSI